MTKHGCEHGLGLGPNLVFVCWFLLTISDIQSIENKAVSTQPNKSNVTGALCRDSRAHPIPALGVLGAVIGGRKGLGFLQPCGCTLSFGSLFSIKTLISSLSIRRFKFKCPAPAPRALAGKKQRGLLGEQRPLTYSFPLTGVMPTLYICYPFSFHSLRIWMFSLFCR